MAVPSPLPPRNGVNATRLRLPASGWPTAQDYVLHRFGHVDPEGIRARFARGDLAVAEQEAAAHRGACRHDHPGADHAVRDLALDPACLLYTSDAADE